MSILAVIVKPEHYVLLGADGVSTDPATGAVAQYLEKIRLYPHLSCAIGITGIGKLEAAIDWHMPGGVANFDELMDIFPELVRHAHDEMLSKGIVSFDDVRSNVVAAGWSDRGQRFAAYRVVSYPKSSFHNDTGETTILEPWVAHEMKYSGTWASSAPDPDALKLCGLNEPRDEDDAAAITRMICAARQSSGKIDQDDMGLNYNAGRFVQLALIQKMHCQTWIAHSWPEDVIGEPIDPSRGAMLPDYLVKDEA